MNREIKFRFWDKSDSTMNECARIDLPNSTIPEPSDENGYIAMQFTGIKDKNGVDIYEGDIVSDHIGRGEVEYSDKYAGFRVNYKDGQCKWFYDYNLRGERDSIEVVSHIFES